MKPRPAVLLVHGAYFQPRLLTGFTSALEAAGFVVRCPSLPTCGDSRPPEHGLQDDIEVIRTAAKELQAAGHPILVVAHSFGGVVATEAITESLYASIPYNGKTSGVIRIVYMSAHLATPGNSLSNIFAKHGFLCDVDLDINDDGTAYVKNAAESFYNDLEPNLAQEKAKGNVTHNFMLVGDEVVNNAPWLTIPSTYIFCDQDVAIKPPLQEGMVRDAEELGGKFDKVVIDAGHCPFYSKEAETVDVILREWQRTKET